MKTKAIQKIGQVLVKNSPTILTGMSVAGLVSTAITAVKATPKAMQILDDERLERADRDETFIYGSTPLPKKDIIKLTWKCYIPTAAMGLLTVACIISANTINLRRNAALAGLYSLSEAALKEYQAKVVETIGKVKEKDVRDEIAKDRIAKNPAKESEIIFTGKGETLCYDALSGRYFKSDIEQIRNVLNTLNHDLLTDMYITLNEVYYGIGLKGTKIGEMLGWRVDDGMIEPEFSTHLNENGTPCLVLDFERQPEHGYKDF